MPRWDVIREVTQGTAKAIRCVCGYDGPVPNETQQQAAICAALQKAEAGDVWGMVLCLHETNLLVAVKRSMQKKWPRLPEEEIDLLLGEAVDALSHTVREGRPVDNPIGFLLKVMHRKAYDDAAIRLQLYVLDPERDSYEPDGFLRDETDEVDAEARRAEAIAIARRLLSQLGQQSIQEVMAYVLHAVEEGQSVVTTQEIVEATGLRATTVRQSLSRGWRRLERLASDEHLMVLHLPYAGCDGNETEP